VGLREAALVCRVVLARQHRLAWHQPVADPEAVPLLLFLFVPLVQSRLHVVARDGRCLAARCDGVAWAAARAGRSPRHPGAAAASGGKAQL
jgi:hypothetical protein